MNSARRFWVGAGLLASAFSPLLVALVLVLRPFDALWQNIVLAVVLALPAVLPVVVLAAARRLPDERIQVRTSTPRDVDVLAFMGSYLVPIAVALFTPDPQRLVAMVVLLALLVAVYVGAELYWLNPLLAVAGYRIHQVVDDDSGATVTVLTRRRSVPAGGRVDGRLIAGGVLIELGSRR